MDTQAIHASRRKAFFGRFLFWAERAKFYGCNRATCHAWRRVYQKLKEEYYIHKGMFINNRLTREDMPVYYFFCGRNYVPQYKNNAREKLLSMMREYHGNPFPETFATKELADLREDFRRTEDKITSMVLGYIYGKADITDASGDLDYFIAQSEKLVPSELKKIYMVKITQIKDLLDCAKEQHFKKRKTTGA